MRIKSVTTWVLGTALLMAAAAPAFAQARPAAPPAKTSSSTMSSDSGSFGIGYSFAHFTGFNAPVGFDANFSKDFSTMSSASVGFVGDFGLGHTSAGGGGTIILVDGGVEFGFKGNDKMTPYALVTGGIGHGFATTNFALDFGGGVRVPLTGKSFGFFAQFDIPIIFTAGARTNGVRITAGITIPMK